MLLLWRRRREGSVFFDGERCQMGILVDRLRHQITIFSKLTAPLFRPLLPVDDLTVRDPGDVVEHERRRERGSGRRGRGDRRQ